MRASSWPQALDMLVYSPKRLIMINLRDLPDWVPSKPYVDHLTPQQRNRKTVRGPSGKERTQTRLIECMRERECGWERREGQKALLCDKMPLL